MLPVVKSVDLTLVLFTAVWFQGCLWSAYPMFGQRI